MERTPFVWLALALWCAAAVLPVATATSDDADADADPALPTQPAPEQFHVAYTANDGEMWVTWATVGTRHLPATNAQCVYGPVGAPPTLPQATAPATTNTYVDGGCRYAECVPWNGTVFSARLTGLAADTEYAYRCGSDETGLSDARSFVASPPREAAAAASANLQFGVVGDIGADARAQNVRDDIAQFLAAQGGATGGKSLRFFLAIGDIAYANGNQSVWDDFGRVWDPFMAELPTLMSPGNHDGAWVYGNNYDLPWGPTGGGESGVSYSVRYPGPGASVSWDDPHTGVMNSTAYWWSLDVGRLHIVTLSTVHEFHAGSAQYQWLVDDLQRADTPERRAVHPWLVVTTHYPLYCTMADCFCNYTFGSDCEQSRQPHPVPGVYQVTARLLKDALEPLLLQFGVDLVLAGHEHSFERTFPVADFMVSDWHEHTYVSPGAPVHVMVGTGGSSPDRDWLPHSARTEWSASRSDRDGVIPYGWLRVDNPDRATLHVQYFNTKSNTAGDGDAGEYLYDEFWIVKPNA